MDFLEKLDFLMNRYDLNKRSLSRKSEIPYTTIDNWYKRGYENLTLPTLRKLATYFNTTLDYWCLDEITDPNYGKSSGFKVEYTEMEHIKKYRSLDTLGQSHVDTVLDWELERTTQAKEAANTIEHLQQHLAICSRFFAYYGRIAAAGTSVEFSDMIAGTKEYPITEMNQNADYVIGVNGDSMEPEYFDGDIVFVQKTDHINIGEIGIFQKGNSIYIKKAGENGLISLNSKYSPLTGDGDRILVLGKVLGKAEEA
ncbi:MAG TPA: hypothetical protein DDY31_10895 [Lachnospiraceae bacterium]|nr:hypothetical protein [Lachnospiraceae bacterium]